MFGVYNLLCFSIDSSQVDPQTVVFAIHSLSNTEKTLCDIVWTQGS